jgi:ribonuclease HII
MRWVGIDEAGYGPNLGPLVMTAVVAEGPGEQEPDVWRDLDEGVARAGDPSGRLWVDDSKAILRHPSGRVRLEATCLALLAAARGAVPGTTAELLAAVGAGTPDDAELTAWLGGDAAKAAPSPAGPDVAIHAGTGRAPFEGASWRVVGVHAVVVGPARFNAALTQTDSKARVHFAAFARLMDGLWAAALDTESARVTHVRSDKHGGRHFYYESLLDAFPDVWIDRGPEGPALSRYTIRAAGRRLELCLQPRADAEDGLVALASIVSKTLRERWMDVFNTYWTARIPGLRPTAGYPGDAQRFRAAIEPHCAARGLAPALWWRLK